MLIDTLHSQTGLTAKTIGENPRGRRENLCYRGGLHCITEVSGFRRGSLTADSALALFRWHLVASPDHRPPPLSATRVADGRVIEKVVTLRRNVGRHLNESAATGARVTAGHSWTPTPSITTGNKQGAKQIVYRHDLKFKHCVNEKGGVWRFISTRNGPVRHILGVVNQGFVERERLCEARDNWLSVPSGRCNDPDFYWWLELGSGGPFVPDYLSHIDPAH